VANQIAVIKPYHWEGMWVFDDERVGLEREALVAGADSMVDIAVAQKDIKNADTGFLLLFSVGPFPGADMQLEWVRAEFGGNVYRWDEHEGWLCPALLRYFDVAPKQLFVQMKELRS
jgi:hypothetical protein